jgi:UDP-N-acetylmuramoylalanine-D-glutamate ligase
MDTKAPNGVADAAALLEKFCGPGSLWLIAGGDEENDIDNADNRAALISAQLLAIAMQAERIADSLAALLIATTTSPGKTHSAPYYTDRTLVAKYPEIFGAAPESEVTP